MAIRWTPALATGLGSIDAQHQLLFARANRLLEAMHAGRSKEEVTSLLEFLASYVAQHFEEEEALMGGCGYPGAAAHRLLHADLRAGLDQFRTELRRDGATSLLVLRTNHLVCDWLLDHVGRDDRMFASWYAQHAPAQACA